MALEEYQKKRKFDETSEPTPVVEKTKGDLIFVIQKHRASHLHYDLRLELNGVLKSWAVPKGPTLDPTQKHLAQMVEDHPFDYKDFEGIIPAGNYGAGTVEVWDEGTYKAAGAKNRKESEKMLAEGLSKGHIAFVLNGKKLCGEFALVQLKTAGKASWLLIKANDECASGKNVLEEDRSVKTGRNLEEIKKEASEKGEYWVSDKTSVIPSEAEESLGKKSKRDLSATVEMTESISKKAPVPHNINPMLATLIKDPFDDPEWIFEIKWDGDRAILEIQNTKYKKQKKINLYSRNLKSFNEKFPSIVNSFKSFEHDAVFDGEIVVLDDKGRSSFQMLQEYQMNSSLRHASESGDLVYYVFDLLYYDGNDLQKEPLEKRRELLQQILPKLPNIQFSEDIKARGKEFYEAAKKQNLEGIMGKRLGSTYQPGKRSKDWVKIKNLMEQEAVIGGFTQPRGSRKGFGALVLGVYEGEDLVYIGHTGGGFTEKQIDFMLDMMKPLITDKSPFKVTPKTNEPATWLKPELVTEVKFQEWTKGGEMRQPIFLGLRDDKKPEEVKRELPK